MFNNDFLGALRGKGDKLLDEYFGELPPSSIFSSRPDQFGNSFLSDWEEQTDIGSHLKSNRSLKAGQYFYQKHRAHILFTLGFMSLPYCYAAADGAKVIFHSEKMRSQPLTRLKDTARFVETVCSPDSSAEALNEMVRQVRWKHAQVREFMKRQSFWNEKWGLPINQEDLAGTNLAFSLVVLRGLRRMRIAVSPEEVNQYFQLWNVIGKALGIEDLVLPSTMAIALELENAIKIRHFIKNEESVWLTKSLSKTLNEIMGFVDAEKIMGALLEPDVAEVLSLRPVSFSPIQQTLINTFLKWKSF